MIRPIILGVVITKLAESTIVFFLVIGFCAAKVQSQSVKISNTANTTGSTITGRVTQHGKGLGDVLVKAWRQPSSQAPLERGGLAAKTDIDGNYRIISESPGNYYVAVDRPGLISEQTGFLGSPRAVSVSAGETVVGIDF